MLGEGQHFAGYTVVRFLGAGGMGEVYLAQHPRLPRRRDALKLLGRAISADQAFRERFLREADLASTLSHQHIVGVHDRGEDRGQLWIAMDYIDGEDSGQLLRRRYPAGMPTELVAAIVSAVGSALDFAHGKGLLHRDVKPANILLSEPENAAQRRILLTDFGIASALDDISDLTPTNTTIGTVAYSAPEQLMGQELDGRADQYALAATAYHLLTGTTIFPASNSAVVIGHHLSAEPPALATSRPELAALDPILHAALAKTPKDRFNSCTDFARAFAEQAVAGAVPLAAPTAPGFRAAEPAPAAGPPPPALPVTSGRRPVTKWVGVAAVGVGAVAVGALGARALLHPNSSQSAPSTPAAAPTSALPVTPTAAAPAPPPAAPPPAPPRGSSTGVVDSALLTTEELSRLLGGVPVTADAAGGFTVPALKMTASSYGPTDHASQVTPPSCVGVVFTADIRVYGESPVERMKTESFAPAIYGPTYYGPSRLEQTVAVFPTAADAQNLFAQQQQQWHECGNQAHPPYPDDPTTDVGVTLGYEQGRGFTLGKIQRDGGDVISLSMASNSGLNGPDACQQSMGIRDNVIVEARTCKAPDLPNISPMVRPDPKWAVPDAQRLVAAMLNKVS
ncbi:MAG: serine/threonine-protein kinase PknH/PknJ [Chloroflexota bacterium]